MRIGVLGAGYVGSTVAACFADVGHRVAVVDADPDVVATLEQGRSPVREEGVAERLEQNAGGALRATTDRTRLATVDVVFVCLPTPAGDGGGVDLTALEDGVGRIGDVITNAADPPVVAVKSTVPPGTADRIVEPALQNGDVSVPVISNPEFLREGTAVRDFLSPDKLVFGGEEDAIGRVADCYEPLHGDVSIVETGRREAETIKYANNVFLAGKLSLVNDIANVCKEYDVDANEVLDAVGLDHRIASEYMRAGLGWGGSCLPKDVAAFRAFARDRGYETPLVEGAVTVNELQPERMLRLLEDHLEVDGARVAVLGLAFKPGTDDVRGSRALELVGRLVDAGADVTATDPVATEEAADRRPEPAYEKDAATALSRSDAAMIATAWPQYDDLDYSEMNRRVVVDGRGVSVDEERLEVYEGLCW